MPRESAALAREHRTTEHGSRRRPQKTYDLNGLIDIAQRTNPETRVAWEHARQAALAAGLAEGTYYPRLAAAATAGAAPSPIPETVVPGGSSAPHTHFVIPHSLEWLLLDFGRRQALVDAAQALTWKLTPASTPSTSRSCSTSLGTSMRSPRRAAK